MSLSYVVQKHGFLNIWKTSGVIEKPYHARMERTEFRNYHAGASTKNANGKEIISPAKRQYIAEKDFLHCQIPADISMSELYWPVDTNQVDYSGMWKYPTDLVMYAETVIVSPEACTQQMRMYCSGAVRVWCGDELVLAFAPYESNIQQSRTFCLNLRKGRNRIFVAYNDYGERNILFRFALQNCGDTIQCELETSISPDHISKAKKFLDGLYLDSFSFCSEDIFIRSEMRCPFDMLLRITAEGLSVDKLFPAGMDSLSLWHSSEMKAGFQTISISYEERGVRLENCLQAEIVKPVETEEADKDIRKRKREYISFLKQEREGTLQGLIASLALNNIPDNYQKVFSDLFYMIENRGDCADFRLLRLLWIYIRWGKCLENALNDKIRNLILSFRYWYDEPGNDAMWFFSENHALSFHVSELLAGSLFPDEIFTNSGAKGSDHIEKAKRLLDDWFNHLERNGYNEWNSITYIPVDLVAFFTLYEFCDDRRLKERAKQALDYTFSVFSTISFKGFLVGSSGRIYAEDLFGTRTHETDSLCRIAWGKGYLTPSDCTLFFALSSYEPPAEQERIAVWENNKKPYEFTGVTGRSSVRISTVKNADYIVSSSSSPREGGPGSQEQLINVMLTDWRGRFWINNPGELKIWGTRRPGFFTGNALTPKVTQIHSSVLLSWGFDGPMVEDTEAKFTQLIAYLELYDDVRIMERSIVLRLGNAFAFIYAENGLRKSEIPSLAKCQVISEGLDNTWYVRVSDINEIPYEDFIHYAENFSIEYVAGEAIVNDFRYGTTSYPLMRTGLSVQNKDTIMDVTSGEDLPFCMKSRLIAYPWKRGKGVYEICYRPDIHYTEVISPQRRIYESDNDFIRNLRPEPECCIVSIPSTGSRVEFSRFFFTPHEVSYAADYVVDVPKEGLYGFSIHTCSLIKVYADGNLVLSDFNSMRIIERNISFSAHFTKGIHHLKIVADDLAERDSQLYIRLTYTGNEKISLHLPSAVNADKVTYARGILNSLYFDKQTYCDSDVNIIIGEKISTSLECDLVLSYPDSNAETESIEKHIVLSPGDVSISLRNLMFKPSGLINASVKTEIDGCVISTKLEAEYYTFNLIPAHTIQDRKKQALAFYSHFGNKTFQTLVARCIVDGVVDNDIFDLEMEKLEAHHDCSDFRITAVIYALRNLSGYFSSEQVSRMRKMILSFRFWSDEPGDDAMWYFSENHAINFHVAELLAGEMYRNELFVLAGVNGSEHVRRATERINAWFDNFEGNGFIEWNSSVYIPIDLIAIISLVIMSSDKALVERGKRTLDRIFGIIAENSFRGVMSSSYGRTYFKNLIGRRVGEISALNWIVSGEGFLNHHSFATVLFCLASYEPPADVLKKYDVSAPTVFLSHVNPLDLDLYAFKTPGYIVSSALNREMNVKGIQEHMFQVTVDNPDCQVWINHPGELSYFGEGRPSYFAGSLVLPVVAQDRNKVELKFWLLKGEADFTHMYVPLRFFDSWEINDSWAVILKNGIRIYAAAKNGLSLIEKGPFRNSEIRSYGDMNIWRVWVSEAELSDSELRLFTDFGSKFI